MASWTFCASPPVYVRAAGGVVGAASGMADLAAFGKARLTTDAQPVALRASVAQAAPQVSRMASRFAQLAVLGAADCLRRLAREQSGERATRVTGSAANDVAREAAGRAAGEAASKAANKAASKVASNAPSYDNGEMAAEWPGDIDAGTRIYLATGLGDVAHTDALYFGVMPPRSEMPPPARFATSGNNMAAFFVAQHAGLSARNLTLSQAELSLECALELALSDIAAGAARSALLGGVDETTLPREFYTRRFDVGPDQVIGEGSGWLVLDAAPERNGIRALGAILGAWVMPAAAAPGSMDLIEHVRRASQAFARDALRPAHLVILPGTGIAASEAMAMGRELAATCQDYLDWSGRFPTAAAVGVAAMFGPLIEHGHAGLQCLHVNRDSGGRTGVIAFEVYPADS